MHLPESFFHHSLEKVRGQIDGFTCVRNVTPAVPKILLPLWIVKRKIAFENSFRSQTKIAGLGLKYCIREENPKNSITASTLHLPKNHGHINFRQHFSSRLPPFSPFARIHFFMVPTPSIHADNFKRKCRFWIYGRDLGRKTRSILEAVLHFQRVFGFVFCLNY